MCRRPRALYGGGGFVRSHFRSGLLLPVVPTPFATALCADATGLCRPPRCLVPPLWLGSLVVLRLGGFPPSSLCAPSWVLLVEVVVLEEVVRVSLSLRSPVVLLLLLSSSSVVSSLRVVVVLGRVVELRVEVEVEVAVELVPRS